MCMCVHLCSSVSVNSMLGVLPRESNELVASASLHFNVRLSGDKGDKVMWIVQTFIYFFMRLCMCVMWCAHSACRISRMGVTDAWEPPCVLGLEPMSSVGTASALDHVTVLPAWSLEFLRCIISHPKTLPGSIDEKESMENRQHDLLRDTLRRRQHLSKMDGGSKRRKSPTHSPQLPLATSSLLSCSIGSERTSVLQASC